MLLLPMALLFWSEEWVKMGKIAGRNLDRLTHLKKVKQQLFNNEAISRAEIARNTGLHKSTVTSLFNELDQDGLVKHLGRGDSTDNGGRKPELYTFNTNYGYVACFNITYDHLYVMFLNVDGQEISFERFEMAERKATTLINIMNRELEKQKQHDKTEHGLLGISISIHAVVDQNQVIHSPYYDFGTTSLQEYFTGHYQVPVLVGNEANLAAIYERDYARIKSPANFIVLSIHRGPGVGVIANSQLFSGFHGMVGELGSVQTKTSTGHFEEVGDYLSADFLQERLCRALNVRNDLDYQSLASLIKEDNPAVENVLNNFATATAKVIYNLRMLYGPEEIYINAPMIEQLSILNEKIQQSCTDTGVDIPVTVIKGGQYVSLLGAGAAIIRQVIGMENVNLTFQWSRGIG